MADKLSAFEVFAGRELKVGHPIVARLVGRRFDQLLERGRTTSPTTRASARRWSRRCRTWRRRWAPRSASPSAPSCRCTRWPTAATRAGSCRASRARRRASCRCCSARSRPSRRGSTNSRRTRTAHEYFRWRQEEANVPSIDRYCTHVLSQSGADATAVPRILDGLGPDEKVELLRQNALDFTTCRRWQRHGAVVRIQPIDERPRGGPAHRRPEPPGRRRLDRVPTPSAPALIDPRQRRHHRRVRAHDCEAVAAGGDVAEDMRAVGVTQPGEREVAALRHRDCRQGERAGGQHRRRRHRRHVDACDDAVADGVGALD